MKTMENEQRKLFRKMTAAYNRKIQDAPDVARALELYKDCQLLFSFVSLLWPNEPLDLQRGNIKVSLEMVLDKELKNIDSERVLYTELL